MMGPPTLSPEPKNAAQFFFTTVLGIPSYTSGDSQNYIGPQGIVVSKSGLVPAARGLRPEALLLQLPRLPHLLPRHDAVVLGPDLIAVVRDLVALLRPRPEPLDGEAVVEVRSEIVHDANGEHDICAELDDGGTHVSTSTGGVAGGDGGTYLENL